MMMSIVSHPPSLSTENKYKIACYSNG